MMPTLLTIAVLHWAVLILPGFNFLLIGQLAASGRRSTAMAAVVGMTTATLLWALLAVAGVGIVFTAHPVIRQLAQVAGGLYLLVQPAGGKWWRFAIRQSREYRKRPQHREKSRVSAFFMSTEIR